MAVSITDITIKCTPTSYASLLSADYSDMPLITYCEPSDSGFFTEDGIIKSGSSSSAKRVPLTAFPEGFFDAAIAQMGPLLTSPGSSELTWNATVATPEVYQVPFRLTFEMVETVDGDRGLLLSFPIKSNSDSILISEQRKCYYFISRGEGRIVKSLNEVKTASSWGSCARRLSSSNYGATGLFLSTLRYLSRGSNDYIRVVATVAFAFTGSAAKAQFSINCKIKLSVIPIPTNYSDMKIPCYKIDLGGDSLNPTIAIIGLNPIVDVFNTIDVKQVQADVQDIEATLGKFADSIDTVKKLEQVQKGFRRKYVTR